MLKKTMNNNHESEAYKYALIWGLISVPIIFIAWFITAIFVYFGTGGSIVGGHDNPTPLRNTLLLLLLFVAAIANCFIVVAVYKHNIKKQKPRTVDIRLPIKVYITGILIPLIAILAYLGYGWFSENKTGRLNPYTDECIRIGAKGAKGAGCVWE